MASTSTKAVSFRIPVDTYVQLLEEASRKGYNMTELLFLKIFSQDSTVEDTYKKEAEEKILTLENDLVAHKQQIQDIEKENAALQQALNDVATHNEESRLEYEGIRGNYFDMQETYEHKINQIIEQRKQVETQLKNAEQLSNSLRSTIKHLENVLEHKSEEYERDIDRLKQHNIEKEKEINVLSQTIETYEIVVKNLDENNKQLKQKADEAAKVNTKLHGATEKEKKEKEKKLIELSNKLKNAEKINIVYKREMDTLKAKVTDSEDKVSKYKDVVTQLIETHNQEIDQLNNEVRGWICYADADEQLFLSRKWTRN